VVTRIRSFKGRASGGGTARYHDDGAIEFAYRHKNNGRGPSLEGRARIARDGTPVSFEARGTLTFGTAIDERFAIKDGVATWKSSIESGEARLERPAFYVPMAPWPEIDKLLYEALQQSGGAIDLLPAGQARLTRAGEIDGGALVAWHIEGLDFSPRPVWTDAGGQFVGVVDEYSTYLAKGSSAPVERMVAAQRSYQKSRDVRLARELTRRPPAAGLAIVGARVLDIERGRWRDDQTVVVTGDRIAAVGPSARIKPPAGAVLINGRGKALIPGLWDMHAHLGDADGILDVASGVTTVRELAVVPDAADELKARFESGEAIGPHVYRSGFVEGRGENSLSTQIAVDTEAEAAAAIELFAGRGYKGIKIYNSMKPAMVPVLARLAHARGLHVSGHVPAFMRAEDVVRAGYDEIQHINMLFLNFLVKPDTDTRTLARFTLVGEGAPGLDLDSAPVRDFIKLLAAHKVAIDPTVAVFEWMFLSRPGEVAPGHRPLVERLPVQVGRGYFAGSLAIDADSDAGYRAAFAKMLEMVRRLHAAGVQIVAGTDSIAGLTLHRELELYVEAGIPAADVLRLATLGSAKLLKVDRDAGSIARGKRADLVLIDGDPLARISDVARAELVIKGGAMFDPAALYKEVGVAPAK
jgi:cytosine/adenosine deaminase-related metal-dependent hydrolase